MTADTFDDWLEQFEDELGKFNKNQGMYTNTVLVPDESLPEPLLIVAQALPDIQ